MAKTYTGCIADKKVISDTIRHFAPALKSTALVHYRAMKKYTPYQWYTSPDICDSSVENNLNAMMRHFISHKMGFLKDNEGLPHLFHLGCRCSMAVSVYYKKNICPVHRTHQLYDQKPDWMDFITPEEILSLSKYTFDFFTNDSDGKILSSNTQFLESYIWHTLGNFLKNPHQLKQWDRSQNAGTCADANALNEILDIDKLYYAVYQCILSYIKESDILSVIDMDTLDEYEQTLIDGMKSMV